MQWRIQDFPQGAPAYNFDKFAQKLHEIERIWMPGWWRPSRPPRSANAIIQIMKKTAKICEWHWRYYCQLCVFLKWSTYLGQCDVGEPLEGEFGFLAGFAVSLSPEDPCGRHGAEPHPVPDEQDHVPRHVHVHLPGNSLQQLPMTLLSPVLWVYNTKYKRLISNMYLSICLEHLWFHVHSGGVGVNWGRVYPPPPPRTTCLQKEG